MEDTSECGIATINPYRYRSYYYDAEIGMYYLQSRYYDPELGRFVNSDESLLLGIGSIPTSYSLWGYCNNNVNNFADIYGFFGTPLQWLCAAIGGIAGWLFGDFVARAIGLNPKGSFWSQIGYWAVRGLAVAGGCVLGYVAGTKLLNIITKFIYNKGLAYKLPAIVRWFLGIPAGSQLANDLYQRYASHIFSSDHIRSGILKIGSSQRQIFDRIFSIIQSCIPHAQNGSNQIHTIINGYKVTIRFFFKDGNLTSINAFMGWAVRIVGKLFRK